MAQNNTISTETYSFERFKKAIEKFKHIKAKKQQNVVSVAKKAKSVTSQGK